MTSEEIGIIINDKGWREGWGGGGGTERRGIFPRGIFPKDECGMFARLLSICRVTCVSQTIK